MLRLVILSSLLSLSALAAGSLEASRSASATVRQQMNDVRAQQMQLRGELNTLSARIDTLKTQAKGKLTPGSELDGALKRSQELSAELSGLASTLSSREGELESANLALLSQLSNELGRLRADFDRQTDRTVRKQIIVKLRALRAEREQVRAAIPAAKVPALEAVRPSDDPEDMLEQADLLKDNEDKVRQQLKSLEKRIAEAKEERELDGRVRQFLGDESLFDEQDRRLRVRRESVEATAGAAPATRFSAGEGQPKSDTANGFESTNPSPPSGPFSGNGPQAGGLNDPGGARGTDNPVPGTSPNVRAVQGNDARPTLGGQRIAGGSDDDDLEELEIQRKQLKGLADQLKTRAAELQKQAGQLK